MLWRKQTAQHSAVSSEERAPSASACIDHARPYSHPVSLCSDLWLRAALRKCRAAAIRSSVVRAATAWIADTRCRLRLLLRRRIARRVAWRAVCAERCVCMVQMSVPVRCVHPCCPLRVAAPPSSVACRRSHCASCAVARRPRLVARVRARRVRVSSPPSPRHLAVAAAALRDTHRPGTDRRASSEALRSEAAPPFRREEAPEETATHESTRTRSTMRRALAPYPPQIVSSSRRLFSFSYTRSTAAVRSSDYS